MIKWVEATRIIATGVGFYWIYDQHSLENTLEAMRWLVMTLALALCGTCAAEGLFFSEASALEKGYRKEGDSANPYQLQNLSWFIAATVTGVWIFFAYGQQTAALVTYAVFMLLYFWSLWHQSWISGRATP